MLAALASWAGATSAEAATLRGPAAEPTLASAAAASLSAPAAATIPVPGGAAATLEQCVTSPEQVERAATFVGEMTATDGTGRMSMRIELQERLMGQANFHDVAAPGLGVWRSAAPGVKVYRYIKQVTNLSAPAVYRAAVRFRWLTGRGKLIKGLERITTACTQRAKPPTTTTPSTTAPPTGS
jgi:hypothetical protein